MKRLTLKQQKFVEAYTGNGVEAARKAGYKGSDATLAVTAHTTIRKSNVAAALKSREAKQLKPLIASRQERQKFWTEVMKSEEHMRDRLKASELLGRSEADFTEKVELDVTNNLADILRAARERAANR